MIVSIAASSMVFTSSASGRVLTDELTSCLSEGQIAEFIKNDEVEAIEIIRRSFLLSAACFRIQAVDQIDNIEEAAACSVANERTGNRNGQVALSCPCAADENDVTFVGDEGA